MAAKKKNEEESEEKKGPDSRTLLSGLLEKGKALHYNAITPDKFTVSWGSLNLDSVIKLRSGTQVRLLGKGAELGKTSIALVLLKNYLESVPKSKGLFVDAEMRLSDDKKEKCGLKFVDNEDNWVEGTVFILKTNVFELIAGSLEVLLTGMFDAGEHLAFAIDSLDAMITNDDLNKQLWKVGSGSENVKVASVPSLLKILLRRLTHKIVNYDALAIYTSQQTAEIKLDIYSKVPARQVEASGGNGINHYSDIVVTLQPIFGGDYILEKPNEKFDPKDNKKLGHYCSLELKKTSNETTGEKVRYPIQKGRKGSQIWEEREIADFLIGQKVLKNKGAWFNFEEVTIKSAKNDGVELQESFQGLNNVYNYIQTNPEVFQWLKKQAIDLIA